jgi:hypothetical protein
MEMASVSFFDLFEKGPRKLEKTARRLAFADRNDPETRQVFLT